MPKFYRYKLFWLFVLVTVSLLLITSANMVLNNKNNQKKVVDWIYFFTQAELSFDKMKFNLLLGEIKGKNLKLKTSKTNLELSLQKFKLNYNPLYIFFARFKITKIQASEFVLDTSKFEPLEKKQKEKTKFPQFLQRIKLSEANIDNFVWKQKNEEQLSIEEITLSSRFSSSFRSSPLFMTVSNVHFDGKKLDAFIDKIEQEGFFIFDLSQPRIFDESKIAVQLKINNILLAIHKTPKPWLTDRGWDQDIEPLLMKYYPLGIPNDHSYQFINEAMLDIEKNEISTILKKLDINILSAHIVGDGHWTTQKYLLKLNLKTQSPVELSKLPLGQSKFRQSFTDFTFDLALDGKFFNLDDNDIKTSLNMALRGNLVHPEAGNATASLEGDIKNSVLNFDNLNVELKDGLINGSGTLAFKELTTNTNFRAEKMDGHTVVRLFSSVNVPCLIDAIGQISGKLNNPKITIDMTTENGAYEFLNFGPTKGSLLIDQKNMKFDVQTASSEWGSAQLSMDVKNVFESYEQLMDLKSTYTNIDITKLLEAPSLAGKISGTFDLQRSKAKVTAKGDFKSEEFAFFDHAIGDISFKADIREKHLEIRPVTIDLIQPQKTITSDKGLIFDFDDTGYKISGQIIDTLKITGLFKKEERDYLQLQLAPQQTSLDVFSSLLPFTIDESSITGKIDLKYNIYDPKQSQMKSQLSELKINTPEGPFILNKPTVLEYNQKAFTFRNFDITIGNGKMLLNGPLGLEANSSLQIKGDVDFNTVVDFNPFISSSENPITVDMTLKDDIFNKPRVFGKVEFKNDTMQFRKLPSELDEMNGIVRFDGNRISFDNLSLNFDDGPMTVDGFLTTDYEKITGADMKITGKELPFRPFPGLSVLADVKMEIKGSPTMKMSGRLNIVEGQYSQDFSITNFIVAPDDENLDEKSDTLGGFPEDTIYDLKIKNTGDFVIKNNIANIEMLADLDLKGSIKNPQMTGDIEFTSGTIDAAGISFEDAKGYALFNRGANNIPEINLTATNEIQGYTIYARMDGTSENLRLRLDSSPALNYREILSLMFYGQTPDQLTAENSRNFTQTAAISQLASVLSTPLNKISGLDVLRVSTRRESYKDITQRLAVGKSLSDRFSLSFTTDIGSTTDPERAFEMRYQLFDNFYLIAAKDIVGDNRYRFDINFSFDAY